MIELTRDKLDVNFDGKRFNEKHASEKDGELLKGDVLVRSYGKPVLAQITNVSGLDNLRKVVESMEFRSTTSMGEAVHNRLFGAQKGVNVRRRDTIGFHKIKESERVAINEAGRLMVPYYEKYFPAAYNSHRVAVINGVHPGWCIPYTPFINGIINQNSYIKYHYDQRQFKDACTCMFTLRNESRGGHLVFPELGVRVDCPDNSAIIWDGALLVHGVTPIQMVDNDYGYRYTVVYYAENYMVNAEPPTLLEMGREE